MRHGRWSGHCCYGYTMLNECVRSLIASCDAELRVDVVNGVPERKCSRLGCSFGLILLRGLQICRHMLVSALLFNSCLDRIR